MDLQRKLEEIRRKPDHVKLRYTYIAVAISMFFIILLWIFSLADTIKKTIRPKQNVFENIDTQKKSLKEATTDVKNSLDDLNNNLKKNPPANNTILPDDNQSTPTNSPAMPSKTPPSADNAPPQR
jgi:uncharacterized coiled-coil DUF342 family protein